MKGKRAFFKSTLATILILSTALLAIMNSVYVKPAEAAIKYGYKEGETYQFYAEMTSETTTEEGSTKSSWSGTIIIRIKEIEENEDGYDLKITLVMTSSMYGLPSGSLINEQVIEGNRLFQYDYGYGTVFTVPSFNWFTSTDWDDREDEWKDFVDEIDNSPGVTIKDDSASNGVFNLVAKFDVDKSESHIDYDDDGDNDSYTGSLTIRGEYDSNGVLKSFNYDMTIKFNEENSAKTSYRISRGAPPLISTSDIVMFALVGIVCFVVALLLGYFIGKGRASKVQPPPSPPTKTSATEGT